MIALEYVNLVKNYGTKPAVRDVSFEVRTGEVFGLLGPNGAGKTTLIRILMDIIRADSGSVKLFGEPLDPDRLDKVGYLPEERGLYKKVKVLDVMAYFGTLKGLTITDARQRAARWLEKIGMTDIAAKNVETLSKGMSQKVQIAATLVHDPELAVLDEPFSGLDPVNVELIKNLIIERRERGLTTILSTHQMDMVEALCDRVALINKGRMMVYGDVNEVRERYSKNEVRLKLGSPLPSLSGILTSHHEQNGTWKVELEPGMSVSKLLPGLIGAGIEVHGVEKILAPMHDIFVSVVTKEERA